MSTEQRPVAGGPTPDGGVQLPGGIGISMLRVYDTATPDGLTGGSAHVHLACTEGYVVLRGSGVVQTLAGDGFEETPLAPGSVVWFEPGVIHRLVNHGGLEILTLMQNAGLPERGDAVLTFPDEVLADPERYAGSASLPGGTTAGPGATEHAWARRDLAIRGFEQLRARVDAEGPAALDAFFARAAALVRPRVPAWRKRWEATARHLVERTGAQLDALDRGDAAHLRGGRLARLAAPTERDRLGMCGTLDVFHAEQDRQASRPIPAGGCLPDRRR